MNRAVLILEDAVDLRRALERFVSRRGWDVRGVGTVGEAMVALEEEEPDLLLSDIDLPDGSGVDLVRTLKRHRPSVPTILFTGLHDMALAAEGMKAGAVDFLTKPIDLEQLGDAMDAAIEAARRLRDGGAEGEGGLVRGRAGGMRTRLVGRHPSIVELFKRIGTASSSSSGVLIRGESGTGKELVAREVHRHSRPGRPFVAVNCASIPDSLVESELFGHAKGAFTGAVSVRKGRFELAADGTLFLDEIGDASPAFQAMLLRVLEEGEFVPLGSEQTKPFRARVIAATHRRLEEMVETGGFRADLFYRVQVLELVLPPLRERLSDLPDLASHLLARIAATQGRAPLELSPAALTALLGHAWPGNVRELENVLERATITARSGVIDAVDVRVPGPGANEPARPDAGETLEEVVRDHVARAVERCDGNKREAARRLGISPGRLYRILEGGEG